MQNLEIMVRSNSTCYLAACGIHRAQSTAAPSIAAAAVAQKALNEIGVSVSNVSERIYCVSQNHWRMDLSDIPEI